MVRIVSKGDAVGRRGEGRNWKLET